MTTRTISGKPEAGTLGAMRWLWIGFQAAAVAILAVLLTQTIILALWPGLAAFQPLDSYARSGLFTAIPAIGATMIFAWLVKTQDRPAAKFLWISGAALLLSFIPDYVLPIPNRTLAASTAAAFLHAVAAVVTVAMILAGYYRSIQPSDRK